jgi:hypothetical protein
MKSNSTINTRLNGTRQRHRFLSSCIQVQQERVAGKTIIVRQVCFELNSDIINKIEEIKSEYGSLALKPEQLADLRYYGLINSALAGHNRDRSCLVFSSSYLPLDSQIQTTVIRSTIDLQGQILQEIRQDLWQKPQLLSKVIQAHHWLTTEILRQLPLETKSQTSKVFWALWTISAIASSLIIWYFLALPFWLKLLINFVSLYLFKILVKHLINYQLKKWILSQLTSGWLANKTSKRQLGFKLLSLL